MGYESVKNPPDVVATGWPETEIRPVCDTCDEPCGDGEYEDLPGGRVLCEFCRDDEGGAPIAPGVVIVGHAPPREESALAGGGETRRGGRADG